VTLTVRLDGQMDSALTRYCKEAGVSKSLVVQESLAAYLLAAAQAPAGKAAAARPASDNHRAFADAGLLGAVADGRGADKAAVRARAAARQKSVQPRPPRQP
jgi:hypothetical protein